MSLTFSQFLVLEDMFPDIEEKINRYRKQRNPRVRDLLAYLSKAEQALQHGDKDKAEHFHQLALEENVQDIRTNEIS